MLHIHNPPDIFFPAGALFRIAGRKVIFDHHDLFPETVEVKFGPGRASKLAAACPRLTFAVANHVIATNESYAEVARRSGRKGHDAVTIVRNAPPSAWTRIPSRARSGVLAQVRVAYLGAMSAQDGVDGLPMILARLRDRPIPVDAHLTLIGDGDARPALEAEMRGLGLVERVTFTGWVSRQRVLELLLDADVCVDPAPATDVNERSTMMKIAEYLALGKPVVAYDLLETRRTAGGSAMLVPPGDTDAFVEGIAMLGRDPILRANLAEAARLRAVGINWERSERALLGAYAALRGAAGNNKRAS